MADLQTVTRLRGLALPATKGPGGYFESKPPLDVAWGDVLLALFTMRGGRVMRRDVGSVLNEILFEPNTEDQESFVDDVVREAVTASCPHVQVRDVQVLRRDRVMHLTIAFALRTDTSNVQTREVQISKDHVS